MFIERFIPAVIDNIDCVHHLVPVGIPCYTIAAEKNKESYLGGVCNERARKYGFVGKISDESLRKGAPQRNDRKRNSA